jgi:hypothetical protein
MLRVAAYYIVIVKKTMHIVAFPKKIISAFGKLPNFTKFYAQFIEFFALKDNPAET